MRRLAATAVPLTLLVLMATLRIADLTTSRAEVLRAGQTRATNLAQIASSWPYKRSSATRACSSGWSKTCSTSRESSSARCR